LPKNLEKINKSKKRIELLEGNIMSNEIFMNKQEKYMLNYENEIDNFKKEVEEKNIKIKFLLKQDDFYKEEKNNFVNNQKC